MRINVEQGSDSWLALRLGRVTSSLAAGCLRRSPHFGPWSAYQMIMGQSKRQQNEAMKYGLRNEPEAREAYFLWMKARHQKVEIEPGNFWICDAHPWLGASPDGIIQPDGAVQLKCPIKALPDHVLEHHDIQVRIEMCCADRAWCDVFYWMRHGCYYERVYRDHAKEEELIAALGVWYESHILTQTPPPIRAKRQKEQVP